VLAPSLFLASLWKFKPVANKSLEPCSSHIFHILTLFSATLALMRSLHRALHLYQLLQYYFYCLYTISYFLFCLLCLCVCIDDVPFEGEQDQAYEDEFQQLAEEG